MFCLGIGSLRDPGTPGYDPEGKIGLVSSSYLHAMSRWTIRNCYRYWWRLGEDVKTDVINPSSSSQLHASSLYAH